MWPEVGEGHECITTMQVGTMLRAGMFSGRQVRTTKRVGFPVTLYSDFACSCSRVPFKVNKVSAVPRTSSDVKLYDSGS